MNSFIKNFINNLRVMFVMVGSIASTVLFGTLIIQLPAYLFMIQILLIILLFAVTVKIVFNAINLYYGEIKEK